jgi:glycosyltransferase involved in cell wall biosynthesis
MKISAIVLAKDEEELIKDCLASITWVDEIVLIDGGCTPEMLKVAKEANAKIIKVSGDFSKKRNEGKDAASGEWLFYLDIDERVTPLLREEIKDVITSPVFLSSYAIPRRNILLGHEMHWGGWWPDYVLRLIRKDSLVRWEGELHEQPKVRGEVGKLRNPLTHFSHRSLAEMVEKTNSWSKIEAKLLFKSNHPQMTWWRFFSVAFREFWYRGIRKMGFLDGTVGVIEIIYQTFSRMITYAKLWEMQNKK